MKNKPYSKTKGKDYINWYQVIKKLNVIHRKYLLLHKHINSQMSVYEIMASYNRYSDVKVTREVVSYMKRAFKAAGTWVTCACGNQCALIERDFNGAPDDNLLNKLGLDFSRYIEAMMLEEAEETIVAIEERSAEVIELQKQKLIKEAKKLKDELTSTQQQLKLFK